MLGQTLGQGRPAWVRKLETRLAKIEAAVEAAKAAQIPHWQLAVTFLTALAALAAALNR